MKKEPPIIKKYLDEEFSKYSQTIIAAVDGVLQKRLTEAKKEIKKDINNVQTLIDGYVKAREDFKQEFIIMKEEIKKIKETIKIKLGVEISAF